MPVALILSCLSSGMTITLVLSLLLLFTGACSPKVALVTPTVVPTPVNTSTPEPTVTEIVAPASVPTSSLFLKSPQVFQPAATFQVGLGDLDGDGDLDAVFANMGSHSQVWLNDGAGSFTDAQQSLTQQGHGVGIGDLDGDGDLDLLIACASLDGSHRPSVVYLNDGKANFSAGQNLEDRSLSANSVDLIDINGDGHLDACVQYYELPYRVYLNDGKGTFNEGDIAFLEDMELAWGDLDSDGDVDVFAKELGKGYKALLNDGTGRFKDHWQMPDSTVDYGYRSVALGDIDSDGDLDAFVTNGSREAGYSTLALLNDGSGGFTDNGQNLPAVIKAWVELGDLNGDKQLDVFMAIIRQPHQVWINDGKGHFSDSALRLEGDSGTRGCTLGDLDKDGDLDIFVASFFGGSNAVWFNQTK